MPPPGGGTEITMKISGKRMCLALCIAGLGILGTAAGVIYAQAAGAFAAGDITLLIAGTDKARYAPGDTVRLEAAVENTTDRRFRSGTLEMRVFHLEEEIFSSQQEIVLDKGEKRKLSLEWQPPETDFQGYVISLEITDGKERHIAQDTIGADVSSSWVKFPRYGYVCSYEETEETAEKIALMNRYHINAIEYYDWQALHHQPLPQEYTGGAAEGWEDWSGRRIYADTIKDYIRAAKERGMVNMAYNMIYAGTDSFFTDAAGNPAAAEDWKLYFAPDNGRGEGEFSFQMGASPSGNGSLYFMNPLNPDWQEWLFAQENRIFQYLDFDGWHGDTVGEWGKMTDMEGNPLGTDEKGEPVWYVKDTYRQFLNAAKEALGDKYLSFNPVGGQGIEQANTSRADVLYTEFWPWDQDREGIAYNTYSALAGEIERTMEESRPFSMDGKGKSLVVKAYINYYKTVGSMNAPAVLLCDAAVYAAGGSRLELGNGDSMLHVEYYPDDKIPMDDALKASMRRMADFVTAYENLLRDGQTRIQRTVEIQGTPVSAQGESDAVWAYTKADEAYEILHLINLCGTDNEWRDERGKKAAPLPLNGLRVKYYTPEEITGIWLASPDEESAVSTSLIFEKGEDDNGRYLEFEVPSLQYWDLLYMKKQER